MFDYLLFDAIRTARWRDKLGVWFRRTGWRPDDVAQAFPKERADLATFTKFDPPVSSGMRRYVVAQFIAALGGALAIAGLFAKAGMAAVLVPCLIIWAQLYSLGLLNETRPYAIRMELIRLLVIVPLGLMAVHKGQHVGLDLRSIATAGGVYIAASLAGLAFAARGQRN